MCGDLQRVRVASAHAPSGQGWVGKMSSRGPTASAQLPTAVTLRVTRRQPASPPGQLAGHKLPAHSKPPSTARDLILATHHRPPGQPVPQMGLAAMLVAVAVALAAVAVEGEPGQGGAGGARAVRRRNRSGRLRRSFTTHPVPPGECMRFDHPAWQRGTPLPGSAGPPCGRAAACADHTWGLLSTSTARALLAQACPPR